MKLHARAPNSSARIPPPPITPLPATIPGSTRPQLLVTAQAGKAQVLRHTHEPSRRELLTHGPSLLSLLWTYFQSADRAQAEESLQSTDQAQAISKENVTSAPDEATRESVPKNDGSGSKPISKKAFFDISINREPVGQIVVELNSVNAPAGTARFASVISGTAGVSYKRKEFVKITPNYIQHGGLRSYGVDAEIAKKTGAEMTADELLSELETSNKNFPGVKNVAGSVGIIIRDPLKPPPKMKLVARKGKLEIDEEEVGTDPNGTEFVISTKDSPDLDASTLVVGKVVDGMDVVEKISRVKTVQENTSSPYFRAAKLIGDKRAVVAERGFNRPYSKIIVTNCGLLDE